MRFAMATSPSRVNNGTTPISRRYRRTGSLVFSSAPADRSNSSSSSPSSSSVAIAAACSIDRKSTRLNSSHDQISYAVFCLKKKKLSGLERSEFMPPVGVVEGYYTIHSELATMPKTIGKGVQEMDFIVAFPQAFRETIATLVRLGLASREETVVEGTKVRPYDVTSNVIDALPKPKEPELDVDIQRCVVVGEKDGHPAT